MSQAPPSPQQVMALMQSYNENMAQFLAFCNSFRSEQHSVRQQEPPVRQQEPAVRQQEPAFSINYEFPPQTMSQRQIAAAVTTFALTADELGQMSDPVCPISHTEFTAGDVMCRVNRCQHTFKHGDLMRWLDVNHTCPVCRADLLDIPSVVDPVQPIQRDSNVIYSREFSPHTFYTGNGATDSTDAALAALMRAFLPR